MTSNQSLNGRRFRMYGLMFMILFIAVSAHAQKPAVRSEGSSPSSDQSQKKSAGETSPAPGNAAQTSSTGQKNKQVRIYDDLTNRPLGGAIIILDIIGCDCVRDCRVNCKCCINQIVADEKGRFTYDPTKQRIQQIIYKNFSRGTSDKMMGNRDRITLSVGETKIS